MQECGWPQAARQLLLRHLRQSLKCCALSFACLSSYESPVSGPVTSDAQEGHIAGKDHERQLYWQKDTLRKHPGQRGIDANEDYIETAVRTKTTHSTMDYMQSSCYSDIVVWK